MERLLVVLALASACSYGASFDDCDLVCRSPDDCPTGFTCGVEGLCRPEGAARSCAEVIAASDASNNPATGDAASKRCQGTATSCATLSSSSTCSAQSGCSFAALSCTLTTNCSQFMTNQACVAAPGCATDFTTSTCKPITGYCNGSTEPTCEATEDCVFGGGCGGTPSACGAHATETACQANAGCAWN